VPGDFNQAGSAARSAERLIERLIYRGIVHVDPLVAREEVSPCVSVGCPKRASLAEKMALMLTA
jgi:hypothetical protein